MQKVKKVNVVSTFNEDNIKRIIRRERYDININTHVDLMKNSTVITNSEFSRKAIFEAFNGSTDSGRGIDEVQILRPPVDVDTFQSSTIINKKQGRR